MFRRFTSPISWLLLASCTASPSKLTSSDASSSFGLSLNDVSVLMPYVDVLELLDRAPIITSKIPGTDEGFIPEGALAELDHRMVDDDQQRIGENQQRVPRYINDLAIADSPVFESNFYQSFGIFRLASVRFDPCAKAFAAKVGDADCQPQLRIVWQILSTKQTGSKKILGQFDANIHTIYTLSQTDWQEILQSLRTLHRAAGFDYAHEPLGPHPVIKNEGLESAYFKGIIELVNAYARTSNLTHIAAFADTAPMFDSQWPMQAFEVKNGQIIASLVPMTLYKTQRIPGRQGHLDLPSPLVTIPNQFLIPFVNGPRNYQEQFDNTRRIENPNLHDASNTDCASCHMTRHVRKDLEWSALLAAGGGPAGDSNLKPVPFGEPSDHFTSKEWNLERNADFDSSDDSLQMFSFFHSTYAVSQRTINESAEALATIARHEHP